MRIAAALTAVALSGALAGAGLAGTAHAAPSGEAGILACSTQKISSKVARGWCSAGTDWRVGVKCTDGRHYYSGWVADARYQHAICGSGTITHYWIDR
ncbi:hypothetical protein IAG44_04815 [Streptomyces roseirectus]|uniref:Uncharacterized protein n=1 Tax=Streptomyces roseirectus TaxID=2768066 RepID=A0A7H0I7S5_9ACTN|nr:hypothetical protein [Streptomyces roseirectus]QNP68841.1 hypothetical protein IAG44_04815 [Streptomyces roseirectus]